MTPRKPVVGFVRNLIDPDAIAELNAGAETIQARDGSREAMNELIEQSDAIILHGSSRLDGEQLRSATRLKLIAVTGAGQDNVDDVAAAESGIRIVSGLGVRPDAVAEYSLAALVFGRRQLVRAHDLLSRGDLDWGQRFASLDLRKQSVSDARLGLVGYGHIGRSLGTMAAQAFGTEVGFFDPVLPDSSGGARRFDELNSLLDWADMVSVHVPLLPSTRNLIGADELRRIGPTGLIVNASRGGIVDEVALVAALKAGEIGSAVLDTFEGEPPIRERVALLRSAPTLIMTPHLAGQTVEANAARERNAVTQILELWSEISEGNR